MNSCNDRAYMKIVYLWRMFCFTGKSLKLEQLRKDCIGPGAADFMPMTGSNNNNNPCKSEPRETEPAAQPNTRPPSREDQQPPMFNPFTSNFYPDFGAGFPIPVNTYIAPIHNTFNISYNPKARLPPKYPDMCEIYLVDIKTTSYLLLSNVLGTNLVVHFRWVWFICCRKVKKTASTSRKRC